MDTLRSHPAVPEVMRPTAPGTAPRKVRVLTLVDFLGSYGGAEQLALALSTRLDPERFESTLCVSRWPPAGEPDPSARKAVEHLSDRGVRLLGLGRSGKHDVWVWGGLARLLRRERIDVLHAHKFGSNLWGTVTARLVGVPVVLAHEHSWSYQGQALRQLLDRQVIARGADRLIAVSREDQRRMIEIEHIPPERTLFMPNGIPSATPAPGRDVRAELAIPPGAPVIGTVGSLLSVKAFDVLLRATAQLIGELPHVRVVIVGEGPERAALEGLAHELDLGETVQFLGRRDDVPDLLGALDIAVCCSNSEGSPLSVMEYMQAQLPVVATTVGGIPDLIESGVHGLLVPPRDPTALANALAELAREPERARAMGARGGERQRAEFDIGVLTQRLEALYCELLAGRGRQGFIR